MECTKEKRSYHFNVTEVVDGKIQEVMNFNFCGHHDLADCACRAEKDECMECKHASQLVLGLCLLRHVLKKYPDNAKFAPLLAQLDELKRSMKCTEGECDRM